MDGGEPCGRWAMCMQPAPTGAKHAHHSSCLIDGADCTLNGHVLSCGGTHAPLSCSTHHADRTTYTQMLGQYPWCRNAYNYRHPVSAQVGHTEHSPAGTPGQKCRVHEHTPHERLFWYSQRNPSTHRQLSSEGTSRATHTRCTQYTHKRAGAQAHSGTRAKRALQTKLTARTMVVTALSLPQTCMLDTHRSV